MSNAFDIIVIGGGHAGCEAAWTTARLGKKTLLVSLKKSTSDVSHAILLWVDSPKAILVREIDALGGIMAKDCRSFIHSVSKTQYAKRTGSTILSCTSRHRYIPTRDAERDFTPSQYCLL